MSSFFDLGTLCVGDQVNDRQLSKSILDCQSSWCDTYLDEVVLINEAVQQYVTAQLLGVMA